MEIIFVSFAAIAGAALGWVQFKMLQLTILKGKWWLFAVKLPLWAAAMFAAASISIAVLVGFVAGATVSFIAFGYAQWRKQRKGV
jgi:hypothetical protein